MTTDPTTTALLRAANAAVPATPAVRTVAARLGVVLADLRGTGAAGRITIGDVRAAATADPDTGLYASVFGTEPAVR